MRSAALFAGILLLFLVTASVAEDKQENQANQENQPALYIKELNQDIGTVYESDNYIFNFIVKNTGKADLVIESVKPG